MQLNKGYLTRPEHGQMVNIGKILLSPVLIPVLHSSTPDFIAEPIVLGGNVYDVTALKLNRPYAVIFTINIAADIKILGPDLENHPIFPDGTDVIAARVTGENRMSIRMWSKGKGEVTASLESAGAALAAASINGRLLYPEAYIDMPTASMYIKWDRYASGRVFCDLGADNNIAG